MKKRKKKKKEETVIILSCFLYMQHIKIKSFPLPAFAIPQIDCTKSFTVTKTLHSSSHLCARSCLLCLPPHHLCVCASTQHNRLQLLQPPDAFGAEYELMLGMQLRQVKLQPHSLLAYTRSGSRHSAVVCMAAG